MFIVQLYPYALKSSSRVPGISSLHTQLSGCSGWGCTGLNYKIFARLNYKILASRDRFYKITWAGIFQELFEMLTNALCKVPQEFHKIFYKISLRTCDKFL